MNTVNGALHFTATWSGDVETFAGVLTNQSATGIITRKFSTGRMETTRVVLVRTRDEDETLSDMPRDEWKGWLTAQTKRLGPKC